MKAMILAAGLGTRLKPLTNSKPKALVNYQGSTLLDRSINFLIAQGIDEIIVNVHHFGDQIIKHLSKSKYNVPIHISDESSKLLDTGGAIKNASHFFNDDFLLYNVDVISEIDIQDLANYHKKSESMVSLVVRDRETSRYLLFDENLRMCGWENRKSGERIIKRESKTMNPLAFSGIHMINPSIFSKIPEEWEVFSLIDLYLLLCSDYRINAYLDETKIWLDIGKPEHLKHLS